MFWTRDSPRSSNYLNNMITQINFSKIASSNIVLANSEAVDSHGIVA